MLEMMNFYYFYIIGSLDHTVISYARNGSLEFVYKSKVDIISDILLKLRENKSFALIYLK